MLYNVGGVPVTVTAGKLVSGSTKIYNHVSMKIFLFAISECEYKSFVMIPLSGIISPISRIMVNYPHNVFMFNDLRGGRGTL